MNIQVLSARDKVNLIEDEMNSIPAEFQIKELPLRHFFCNGIYAREMLIPAGVLLTGKIHKYPQINILSKGRMRVLIGDKIEEIDASFTVISPPGTKRVAYAVTDCVWTTFLPTDETDHDIIEAKFTASSEKEYQEFLEYEAQKCLS